MSLDRETIAKALNVVINRLEEARNNTLASQDPNILDFESIDMDPADIADNLEGAEAALLVCERRIDELIQVLGEEIDSLRSLLEKF